jgi:hypothetical protein
MFFFFPTKPVIFVVSSPKLSYTVPMCEQNPERKKRKKKEKVNRWMTAGKKSCVGY